MSTMKTKQINTEFAEMTMQDEGNSNLHFIAFNNNSVLAVDPKNNKAHFFYDTSEYKTT